MAQKVSNRKRSKNSIQNVRVVDTDEGTDDIVTQRLLSAYASSEGQIRIVCGAQGTITPGTPAGGIIGFDALTGTDDFASFASQYQEFRVRAIQFKIYDIQPNSTVNNIWSTFHQVGGSVPVGIEDVMDRPDARTVSPGSGTVTLNWVAHGIPEMQFQSVNTYNALGGLSYYIASPTALTVAKYTTLAKFIVDFRGRR